MRKIWLCIPSKRPLHEVGEVLAAWKERGYKIALAREWKDGLPSQADSVFEVAAYQGWARSTNLIISHVMACEPNAEWFIGGGDDYWPDPTKTADDIAIECHEYFHGKDRTADATIHDAALMSTFGVMQPTGDRWMEAPCQACGGVGKVRDPLFTHFAFMPCVDCLGSGVSAVIDRIAGSPWMGREFCRRMYHGSGPMYNGYYHNFADEELQNVAQKLGVFWQRRDLTQEHRHWARPRGDWRDAPDWARKINDPQQSDWERSKALFAKRKAAGFPGSEPLEL